MDKFAILILRIKEQEKEIIADAAAAGGENITTLVRRAALNESKKVLAKLKRRPNTRRARSANLLTLCSACHEATKGGRNGYKAAGRYAAQHLCEKDDLRRVCANHKISVWDWITGKYPDLNGLIPKRRRTQFVTGVLTAQKELERSTRERSATG